MDAILVYEGDVLKAEHRLPEGDFERVIGRTKDADIVVDVYGVSRKHCVIKRRGTLVTIKDLASANGTGLNDRRLEAQKEYGLKNGDKLKIATVNLVVNLEGGTQEVNVGELRSELGLKPATPASPMQFASTQSDRPAASLAHEAPPFVPVAPPSATGTPAPRPVAAGPVPAPPIPSKRPNPTTDPAPPAASTKPPASESPPRSQGASATDKASTAATSTATAPAATAPAVTAPTATAPAATAPAATAPAATAPAKVGPADDAVPAAPPAAPPAAALAAEKPAPTTEPVPAPSAKPARERTPEQLAKIAAAKAAAAAKLAAKAGKPAEAASTSEAASEKGGGAGGEAKAARPAAAKKAEGVSDAPAAGDPEDFEHLPEGAETLTIDELMTYPIFREVSRDKVEKWWTGPQKGRFQIWRRRFKPSDVICREGEHGSTAFYIAIGRIEIRIGSRLAAKDAGKGKTSGPAREGFLRRVARLVRGGAPPTRRPTSTTERRYIPIDASVDLDMQTRVAELKAGDVFGEMSCLSFYPRSATCVAAEDVESLELLRSALDFVKKNSKSFKDQVEKSYRSRTLDTHIRSVPIFQDIPKELLDEIRGRVAFDEREPGAVIFKEGDVGDAFYLIRTGFVKVSQARPGGEVVLAYLGPGQCFGEASLLTGGRRDSTCTALDNVDLVRLTKADFEHVVTAFPEVRKRLWERVKTFLAETERRSQAGGAMQLESFLHLGLMNAQNVLLIDLDRCTRCDECVKACAEAHDGVTRIVRDGLRFDRYLVASSCHACMDPVCMIGCPVGSIRRQNSLEIIIEDWCIGCGKCAGSCPYGAIHMFPFTEEAPDPDDPKKVVEQVVNKGKGQATVCDLCSDVGEPRCVYSCPHDAAYRVKPADFFASGLGA